MRKLLGFLFLGISIFCKCGQIHDFHATDNKLQTRLDSIVHEEMDEIINDSSITGVSIGLFAEGKTHFYNYGSIEKGKQHLPDHKTVYEIASITKTFTGILLANAVLENKINLNEDIRGYLKGNYKNLEYEGQPIKILHLANHTSGLPEDIIPEEVFMLQNPTMFDIINVFEKDSGDYFLEGLQKLSPDTLPGTKIKYSNAGVILLGIILENVYGTSFSELIKKYITDPFDMFHTETVYYATDTANYTKGYDSNGNIMPHITYQIAGAAGGLKSTTGDLIKYLERNIQEEDKAIKLCHEKTIEQNDQAIGLGWQISTESNKDIKLWHDGGEPGFSSYCLIIPGGKIGIICLANQRGRQFQFSLVSNNIVAKLLEE